MDHDAQVAAQARAAANGDARYLASLEVERGGYVLRGLPDRVAQVDAEIARVRAALTPAPAAPAAPEPGPAKRGRAAATVRVAGS